MRRCPRGEVAGLLAAARNRRTHTGNGIAGMVRAHNRPLVERNRYYALTCLLALTTLISLPSCLPKAQGVQPPVVISEFMAVNGGRLVDGDGDPSD